MPTDNDEFPPEFKAALDRLWMEADEHLGSIQMVLKVAYRGSDTLTQALKDDAKLWGTVLNIARCVGLEVHYRRHRRKKNADAVRSSLVNDVERQLDNAWNAMIDDLKDIELLFEAVRNDANALTEIVQDHPKKRDLIRSLIILVASEVRMRRENQG